MYVGIAGHILGDKKLRKLNRDFDADFDRAYRRNQGGEARKIVNGVCMHFGLDFHDCKAWPVTDPIHWSSCFEDRGEWVYIGRADVHRNDSINLTISVPRFEKAS